jgi:hypothetical protein
MPRITTSIIIFLISLSCYAQEITTGNILNQNFDSGEWSGTATDRHGSNIVAAHNGDYIQSDSYSLTTDVGLTEAQIQNGFTTTHSFKYWHWNDYNSTVDTTITITGQDETITQNRTYDSVGCGSINCGSYVTGGDSVIVGRNTESDYSIDVRYDFSDTSNTTSGHWSVDLKQPSITITYESDPIILDSTIENEIVQLFDDFKPEEDLKIIEDNFTFDEEPIMDTSMMVDEPMEMIEFFDEMPIMEEPEIMEEMKEEKDIDNFADQGIIDTIEEDSKEEETLEMFSELIEEDNKDERPEEVKEEESDSKPTKTTNATETDSTEQKTVQSKETTKVGYTHVLDKIDEKIKDVGKNLELKNLITLKAMSDSEILLEAYNVPFYKPRDIYQDQLSIVDNRDIYSNINLNRYVQNDPISTKVNKINEIKNERQQLLIQLEVLKNEL